MSNEMNYETSDAPGLAPGLNKEQLKQYINLKLTILGCASSEDAPEQGLIDLARPLLFCLQEKNRLLVDHLCPVDQRISDFLHDYFNDVPNKPEFRMPETIFNLDRPGLARALSFPPDRDEYKSDIVSSYRVAQGVLHNPKSDRRTTKGVFHIVEGGLPIPDDKKAVPKVAFGHLLQHALKPPKDLLKIPYTVDNSTPSELFVSLYFRPVVCPGVEGYREKASLEIRFLVPGGLVCNLDFVETIFGNAGDPTLPENDAGLDVHHWTGHTGCIILAPQLIELTKKELGLPRWEDASERQRRDGMCWKDESELYNDGSAFKVTCRDARGVIVTLIADNYFGYCKKEVKTQIGYSANLYGLCEEEHAGGTIAYASYDLGDDFSLETHIPMVQHTFKEMADQFSALMDLQSEGYGIDKRYDSILYIPEDSKIRLYDQTVRWNNESGSQLIKLLPNKTYVMPSGYKVELMPGKSGRRWRLIGTRASGTFCHKPCTVSGGGKSEISKSISDAVIQGPVFTADIHKDFEIVDQILKRDYSDRFRPELNRVCLGRGILGFDRSLGSVIKLLTPSYTEYTDEYNDWVSSIPRYIKELVLVVKRFYKPDWNGDWHNRFSVDTINGQSGHELKYRNKRLVAQYMRVGYEVDGSWRIFGLRKDFHPATKIQMEDDITASVVVPASQLEFLDESYGQVSLKFTHNCESRLFQRPDDAIHRGYDKQTESDMSEPGNFLSNYEPLDKDQVRDMVEDSIAFSEYTAPMQNLISQFHENPDSKFLVCSSHPRLVDGKPSKNPRYLQMRQDLLTPRKNYLTEIGTRLYRKVPLDKPLHRPVNAVLPGRRNNPPDAGAGIRSLAVYGPIHYMELPELFIEFISSMTGKSPSTTGAGSEGALTKGPFNALTTITDLNNALVSFLLTGYDGWVTSAGCIGPNYRIDHDISLLIPELWCRMQVEERQPRYLIERGYLERCEDIEYQGRTVLASRLGYRITSGFVNAFFGRIFFNPSAVLTEEMLKPEMQDMDVFADGMDNVTSTHQRVAEMFFRDESIDAACPPLLALLHIMKEGHYREKTLGDPEIRNQFNRESLMTSDWYSDRLKFRRQIDIDLMNRHIRYLEEFLGKRSHRSEAKRLDIQCKLDWSRNRLMKLDQSEYISQLVGTLGADPKVVGPAVPSAPQGVR